MDDNLKTKPSRPPGALLRLHEVLAPHGKLPIAPSTWWQGIKDGLYPVPGHLGRVAVWRKEDIDAIAEAAFANEADTTDSVRDEAGDEQ